jgi:hypothetical protein
VWYEGLSAHCESLDNKNEYITALSENNGMCEELFCCIMQIQSENTMQPQGWLKVVFNIVLPQSQLMFFKLIDLV